MTDIHRQNHTAVEGFRINNSNANAAGFPEPDGRQLQKKIWKKMTRGRSEYPQIAFQNSWGSVTETQLVYSTPNAQSFSLLYASLTLRIPYSPFEQYAHPHGFRPCAFGEYRHHHLRQLPHPMNLPRLNPPRYRHLLTPSGKINTMLCDLVDPVPKIASMLRESRGQPSPIKIALAYFTSSFFAALPTLLLCGSPRELEPSSFALASAFVFAATSTLAITGGLLLARFVYRRLPAPHSARRASILAALITSATCFFCDGDCFQFIRLQTLLPQLLAIFAAAIIIPLTLPLLITTTQDKRSHGFPVVSSPNNEP